ncbi:hypothetical protein WA026_014500 [Henosepilachna vigintioctopunctata]|uniref:Protein white n=2 Tax=Henosepilachna vigintioctopunctata TaxID=420089 RepID=A0AAW1UMA8_9CUCU
MFYFYPQKVEGIEKKMINGNAAHLPNGHSEHQNGIADKNTYKISALNLVDWKEAYLVDQQNAELVPEKKQITFTWCDINAFSVDMAAAASEKQTVGSVGKNKKQPPMKHILKNVNGVAYPGELLVILGSSGAGKTTLLNCMTHRNLQGLTISGSVCINNVPVRQKDLAAQSAYVQQDDLFIPYLTVKEHLIFQARLRMDAYYTYEERVQRVEEVMRELSLTKCANNLIGNPFFIKGISGGERKRLALASELLLNPSLLFCDEPTTGLDSFMALNVIQMLKSCAMTGRTVIATVHQPSSELYHLFDKLCLVAEGRTAFLGTTEEANIFFTKLQAPCPRNFNPADHFIQLLSIVPGKEELCKKSVQSICDAFKTSSLGVKIDKIAHKSSESAKDKESHWSHTKGHITPYKVGWCAQLSALLWRSWLSIIKNPEVTRRRLYVVLLESLLVTVIYYGQTVSQTSIKNLDGAIFFILNSTAFQSIFAVINSFCSELQLFMKEHKDGMYRTDVYYLSKIICDLPLSLFFPVLYTSICYYLVGLNPLFVRFLTTAFIAMMLAQASTGISYVVSAISPDVQIAAERLLIFIIPMLFMGGIYLNIGSIPSFLSWLSNLSWFKFGYEAFMANQWSDIKNIPCPFNTTDSSICVQSGLQVLQMNSMSPSNLWPDIGYLIALAVAFRIIAFFSLLFRVSRAE